MLENHGQIYRDLRFRKSRLVVDGNNLLYLLYFTSDLDQNHGGEYASFKELIEKFFTALRDCSVSPFVVLDGGSELKKLETLMLRAEDRIRRAHAAVVQGGNQSILPQLAKLVFKQTLVQLKVPMAQCYGEADREIAALANEWKCPVLSHDSDFYIYDLPAGLLPLPHFQWKEVVRSSNQSYIPCKSYNISSFSIFFNIQRQLLPTFAALAGNDYVNLRRMESPIKWTQFCPAGSEAPSRLEGLLYWLRGFQQPQEALEAVPGLMGKLSSKKKAEVLQRLHVGTEEYQLPPSALKKFFIHGEAPPFPPVREVLVPEWLQLLLVQCRLSADTLDVLLLQRVCLGCPVDRADKPSANLTSRPLRQVMYGLLLGRGRTVLETDRELLELRSIHVHPTFPGVTRQLELNSLDKVDAAQRLQVLLEALGVKEASLSRVPPQLRLLVAVTYYWLQRAKPCPSDRMLKALLTGLSNGDALRHRAALQIQNQEVEQKLDVGVAHAFNQWQACLKDSIKLNQLLSLPLPEPQVSRLYEGTLVHHLVHQMRARKMRSLIKFNHTCANVYKNLLAVIHQLRSKEAPKPPEAEKKARAQRQQPVDDLSAHLKQLFLLYDDEDKGEAEPEVNSAIKVQEELRLNDLLSVRTRYRTKERANRSQNLDLVTKQGRRGVDLW